LKQVLISSYLAQAYISLIGIVLMPIYLHYLGIEAFGLIGFFLMLQGWLQLLDLGLTPTLSREISLFRAGSHNAQAVWQRLRSLEWILGGLAILCILSFWFSQSWIAINWLKIRNLNIELVATCVFLMGLVGTLRWLTGLYRAGLVGLEKQLWVNGSLVVFTTLKFVVVLPVIALADSPPLAFFEFQALIGLAELSVFARVLYRSLPEYPKSFLPCFVALKAMWPTASAMAFMGGMWVFLTQIDKLILSRMLQLEAFSYFTLATAVAGGVLILVPPLNQVLQPRMTILAAQNRDDELQVLYRTVTQAAAVIFFVLGGGLALFAEPLLWAWTGNRMIAIKAAPILFWYGLTNALIGILGLPFMLQFSYGYLRLHVFGNILLALTLLPTLVLATLQVGAVGAGRVLFLANLLFLLLWVPLAHRRLMPQAVWRWPFKDIFPIALISLLVLWSASMLLPPKAGRLTTVLFIAAAFLLSAATSTLSGTMTRGLIRQIIFREREI
jgi:O-antigen/teichoic acid export membrane protein